MDEINKMDEEERVIAKEAGRVLTETFIAKASNGPVVYVTHDTVVYKDPNSEPVMIKQLYRNLEISKRLPKQGTVKIKKKDIR